MQAPSFRIREATPHDTDQLCNLASEVLNAIHTERTIDPRPVLEQIMNSGDRTFVVVADNGRTLCGYAYASYKWRAEFRGEMMDIVALFVEPDWRSKGVGRALIMSLVENARQRGIRRIRAEVHSGNFTIERMLEANGFHPERRTLWSFRL
jgi:GNAT superfamily N-acetyltransferase